jgi:enoyl-CoA hydratase/carnithine racemase
MELERRREDHVEILTLNRPEQRNALSPALLEQLSGALAAIKQDHGVRAVVLTAAGDRAFCAGMDLKAFMAAEGGAVRDEAATADFTEFIRGEHPKPVLAAVNGAAVAGGLELLMGCDLVVAAEHARFGLPEVKRGLFAAGGGLALPARIPLAVALELGLTGDLIGARRAYELGLVNRVAPAGEVLDTTLDLARSVAENAPLAVAATKAMMRATISQSPSAPLEMVEGYREAIFNSEDAREGAVAFAQRRPPRWVGR